MQSTIVLFDIDGTLVSCGGAGRRALGAAFVEMCARDDMLDFGFGGLTDRAIVRRGLCAAGLGDDEATIDGVIERYLTHLPEMVQSSPSYRVLPGVAELLLRLRQEPNVAIGLGTGNVKPGAFTKLSRGKLQEHFAFGGFGCDHEQRSELIAIGARRGSERLGRPLSECRVVVVGDTPRDIAAAHAIGAECVAVATGEHDAASLAQSGADAVLVNLADPGTFSALFR